MNLDKPTYMFDSSERVQASDNLAKAKEFGTPNRVWVEDGHVFVEGHDGELIVMNAEVAIVMGRLLGDAGTKSLINRVMDDNHPA